ncbi:carbohydrate-binding module family 19 protein [Tortispora caseinolytica NRRL Y-17796]|uniref:chitinase n=1 Tax=Tortispora caseinolytica NRRL Y-17796 TaxID=767744 RepID=A0A1E4TIY3_9ASCO|nr:carbohydrate-binding module family 19 protein [Tortispora caseinolytica NRRL Y-17796]
MLFSKVAITIATFASAVLAFDPNAKTNMVLYWGQNSAGGAGTQQRLSYYCQDDTTDIIILSFLMTFFGTGGLPEVNFANACEGTYFPGTSLLQCDTIAEDIKTCQNNGKIVLLSLGGAAGSYGFTSDTQAKEFAQTLWNLFGAGTSSTRPFGDSVVDGFDLDIEGGTSIGYAALVTELRSLASSSGSNIYIGAAPQCPYPDAWMGNAIQNSYIDFLFVQFYNNYCRVGTTFFNFDTWQTQVAGGGSYNPNAKIFLGVPASPTAAGSGYVSASELNSYIDQVKGLANFGGVMMWDASQAYNNIVSGGVNYAQQAKNYLLSGSSGPGQSSAPAVATSTATAAAAATTTTTTSSTSTQAWWTPDTSAATSTQTTAETTPETSAATTTQIWWTPDTSAAAETSTHIWWTPDTQIWWTPDATVTVSTHETAVDPTPDTTTTTGAAALTRETTRVTINPTADADTTDVVIKTTVSEGVTITITVYPAENTWTTTVREPASVPPGNGAGPVNPVDPGTTETTDYVVPVTETPATTVAAPQTTAEEPATTATGCIDSGSSCSTDGEYRCSGTDFAVCSHNEWVVRACAPGTACKPFGSSIICDFASGLEAVCPSTSSKTKREFVPLHRLHPKLRALADNAVHSHSITGPQSDTLSVQIEPEVIGENSFGALINFVENTGNSLSEGFAFEFTSDHIVRGSTFGKLEDLGNGIYRIVIDRIPQQGLNYLTMYVSGSFE